MVNAKEQTMHKHLLFVEGKISILIWSIQVTYFALQNQGCENLSYKSRHSVKPINTESEWDGSELTMLEALKVVFPNNFCVISEIIRSKTCLQVNALVYKRIKDIFLRVYSPLFYSMDSFTVHFR